MNRHDPSLTPRGRRRDAEKEALDRQTSYLTLLPHMDEGFHSGYHAVPGIVTDQNQRPREWLENVARYMQTQGEDVGYSIPDVLASEQQLRRLARLPHEIAMRHQEMIDYRAVLALLLLWDSWPKDETWPVLSLDTPEADGEGFVASVRAALSPERAGEGLRVFTLSHPRSETPDVTPLCLLSRAMVLMPAANPGDLSGLLPARVTWYDRERKRFTDPCGRLEERDLTRLLLQLRLLQALNERADLNSLIYSPDASLCGLLERFASDLLLAREPWRRRFESGDEAAAEELRARLCAVYGLRGKGGEAVAIEEQTIRLNTDALAKNPLVRSLLPEGSALPELVEDAGLTLYLLDGVPFARRSAAYLLEPAGALEEAGALSRVQQEVGLLSRFRPEWNRRMAACFARLRGELSRHVGVSPRLLNLLDAWAREHADYPAQGERDVTLQYPMRALPAALPGLLGDLLGPMDEQCIRTPFSDCLLVVEGAERAPYEDAALAAACLVGGERPDAPARYIIPPLSPALAAWLMAQDGADDAYAPRLELGGLRCRLAPEGDRFDVSLRITARTRGKDAATTNAVTFRRAYELRDRPEPGAAYALPGYLLPYVAVWPNVRLSPGLWKQYFVYAHQPDSLDVWTPSGGGWVQGTLRTAADEGPRKQMYARSWQTACTDQFPAYIVLKRGELSLGALVNDRPRQQLKHEPAAVAGIDFGSIATTVMLRQGEKIQPAVWPRCLHQALLCASDDGGRFLTDELLPKTALLPDTGESTFYSVMDMFTDVPDEWRAILRDGHIYYRESLAALMRKGENSLYYDMKWGEEDYVLRLIRLFLKQVMVQASLSARLWGSPSVSWRVSMPNALPLYRQEAYLEMMRGLSREVAQETGMPLSRDCPPVLYATENQADGLYFLSRNEVNAHSGYVNMDIGGGTTDVSVWLNNARHATVECSLLLGCRQMLFDSLSLWRTMDFEQDFLDAPAAARDAAQEVARALRQGAATARGRQKSMLLLDDFFAGFGGDIRSTMARARSEGRVTYVESLLLFNIGFLFAIAGELLHRAWLDEELRALLPSRMELCVAGNGGQLLKAFDDEQREKLCRLALSRLDSGHPLAALLPVQSRHPKQEVAIGLLNGEDGLQSALQGVDRWNGTPSGGEPAARQNLLKEYLPKFYAIFPQAAKRMMPDAFEGDGARGGARLTATAGMEVDTIFENERMKTPEDDMAAYVRCFAGLKRLWRV